MLERKVYSVSQINRYIHGILENDVILSSVWIRGEISNCKKHSSGHIYFTLKDEYGSISAIMFRDYASLMPYEIENGMNVLVCGYVSSYERTGQYQLYAQIIEPDGEGALSIAFERLKKKLSDEGLFDEDFKREIPEKPDTIAVITSPTGAAVRDIINISRRRNPSVRIVVVPSLVQGENAVPSIVSAIKDVNRWKGADVIILGRGGGSMEDLWAFNDERVVRAVFGSEIPVISAVGHETDFTLTDFVSDLRAPTPSAAAELAVNDVMKDIKTFMSLSLRLENVIKNKLIFEKEHISKLQNSAALRHPEQQIADDSIYIENCVKTINKHMIYTLENEKLKITGNCRRLELLNPMKVLSRGYCAAFDKNGTINKAEDVVTGEEMTVRFSDGFVTAKAERKELFENG
ncbi:MAG: exodeoxyribonuclease VII large subunit [Clostridia bacterium]|jgi:exodeoxyribonuclease VII large subunit|nr:exodeoxyribonuclease VII large subunit [Clostridia bacterium]